MSSCPLSLSRGVDFYGGDIDNQYAESLEACTQACAANSQCAAASYVGGKRDGRCHPKGIKNGASLNSNVEGVYVVIAASSSSTSTLPSASAVSSSIASSSVVTSSSISSTPSPTASPNTLSSSTSISSIRTRSDSTTTPTSLATCDGINRDTNLVENPSFEVNTSIRGSAVPLYLSDASATFPDILVLRV